MGWVTYALVAVFAWVAIPSFVQLYQAFHAPRCPEDAEESACWRALFTEGEPVDVSVYVTADKKLKWWTLNGLKELQATPLWNSSSLNTTSLPYGETAMNITVTVPLSAQSLHSVRQNESMLYVHCYLSRAGKPIAGTLRGMDDGVPADRRVWPDLLHASAPITKRLPMTKKPRRSLLGNSTDQEGNNTDNEVSVLANILGWELRVFPYEGLSWSIAFFTSTAFLPPHRILAAGRQIAAVVIIPWLWKQRANMKEAEGLKQLQEQSLDQQWWLMQGPTQISPHIVPKVRVALSTDGNAYDGRKPPPLLYKEMDYKDGHPIERDIRYTGLYVGKNRALVPPLHVETWGTQQRYWRPLDSNITKGDIEVMFEFDVTGMWRFTVMQTIKQSLKMYMQFGFSERDLDDVRDFMFRHPLHILAIMQVIGFMQMFLTTMAFKNDISFFKGRNDYHGLSSRSLATDCLQEIIIFLYLFDYEDISRIVLFQLGTSSLISAWKYIRVSKLQLLWQYFLPWFSPTRGSGESQNEQDTEEIDAKGMRYLCWILYPLSACWGVYNLYYYPYKSWWSWLISSLADFAYSFGFVNMMPQIFINYKLKSVAHMPWRVLAYKFFNTFIDDVFAFFIMSDYMTKKHRYMTLRDDVIFFIFMYQKYIYNIDYARADEFGYVHGEENGQTEFKVYVDPICTATKYRWRLYSPHGDILGCHNIFGDEESCWKSVEQVKHSSKSKDNFLRETDKEGKLYFTLITSDGERLGRSYGMSSEKARDKAIEDVIALCAKAAGGDEEEDVAAIEAAAGGDEQNVNSNSELRRRSEQQCE